MSRELQPTVSIILVRAVVVALEAENGPAGTLLQELGLRREELDVADRFVPAALLGEAFARGAELSRDPCFGLTVGSHAAVGAYEVLDYCLVSSRTLREAIEQLVRYFDTLSGQSVVRLEEGDEMAHVVHRFRVPMGRGGREACECFFAAGTQRLRAAMGNAGRPLRVLLAHSAPRLPAGDTRRYERALGTPVVFDQPINAFEFARKNLDHPLTSADASLRGIVQRYAEQRSAALARPAPDLVTRLEEHARTTLAHKTQPMAAVAKDLGTSTRTLQRQLASAGTSYVSVVDRVRRERALQMLEQTNAPVSSIAFSVGFASPGAFTRAFQRWEGRTPVSYRASRRYFAVK